MTSFINDPSTPLILGLENPPIESARFNAPKNIT
jgi:hypothetical protein